ncbi:MAG: MBL fold metallo-hydrolase [Acidobacteria bacterium]|nr:MBL fold metallo-hydrolase [Acidobacteriota bacterium]
MSSRSLLLLLTAAGPWLAPVADPIKPYLSSPRRAFTAPELRDAPDEWIDRSLKWADDILDRYPPAVPEHPVRRAALIRLDDVLHIESAPRKPLVQQFYRARIEKAVREIERTRVTEGMRIWKLYNHGFFVRTAGVSFAIDIVPGTNERGFSVDAPALERVADQADAFFISHLHGDHANQAVARLFLARGKPVVAPEGLWAGQAEFSKALLYPKRSTTLVHEIPIQSGRKTLKLVAYPGHQGASPIVNVNLVTTPEGFTILHTGDQSGGDFDWIDRIGAGHKVDVLMPNCWTTDIQRMARGVNPKLILTGHENEMGHTVDHREDYTQTYNHLFGTPYPFLVLGWGESFHYRAATVRERS